MFIKSLCPVSLLYRPILVAVDKVLGSHVCLRF